MSYDSILFNYITDDSIRLAIGQTLQSVNNNNQEIVKKYTKLILPLTFFAMHAEKVPGLLF